MCRGALHGYLKISAFTSKGGSSSEYRQKKGLEPHPVDDDLDSRQVLTKAGMMINDDKLQKPATLSDREVEIIELVTAGFTNKDIADLLEISKRTVDNHISNIL